MSSEAMQPASAPISAATMEAVVVQGDLARLTPAQRLEYYRARCDAAGLDPRAQPFEYIALNGKLRLYATKSCTDQLASKHGIRVTVVSQVNEDKMRVVTVRAETKDGRGTDDIGVVPLIAQDVLGRANEYMKALTKAKRRAILSVCGLGMLDETEIETIPTGRVVTIDPNTGDLAGGPSLAEQVIDKGDDPFSDPPPRLRTVRGIPLTLIPGRFDTIKDLQIKGRSVWKDLTWGQFLDFNAEDWQAREEFLSSVVALAEREWSKIDVAKRQRGLSVIESYQRALCCFEEYEARVSAPASASELFDAEKPEDA